MSLPFLRKKQVAGLIMAKRKPDGGTEETGNAPEPQDESHPLSSAASDLMSAISAGDQDGVARALEAAIQICQSYPEQEPQE